MVEIKFVPRDDCESWDECESSGLKRDEKCIYHASKERGEIGLICPYYKGDMLSENYRATGKECCTAQTSVGEIYCHMKTLQGLFM